MVHHDIINGRVETDCRAGPSCGHMPDVVYDATYQKTFCRTSINWRAGPIRYGAFAPPGQILCSAGTNPTIGVNGVEFGDYTVKIWSENGWYPPEVIPQEDNRTQIVSSVGDGRTTMEGSA
jgi:hypothetical protein